MPCRVATNASSTVHAPWRWRRCACRDVRRRRPGRRLPCAASAATAPTRTPHASAAGGASVSTARAAPSRRRGCDTFTRPSRRATATVPACWRRRRRRVAQWQPARRVRAPLSDGLLWPWIVRRAAERRIHGRDSGWWRRHRLSRRCPTVLGICGASRGIWAGRDLSHGHVRRTVVGHHHRALVITAAQLRSET